MVCGDSESSGKTSGWARVHATAYVSHVVPSDRPPRTSEAPLTVADPRRPCPCGFSRPAGDEGGLTQLHGVRRAHRSLRWGDSFLPDVLWDIPATTQASSAAAGRTSEDVPGSGVRRTSTSQSPASVTAAASPWAKSPGPERDASLPEGTGKRVAEACGLGEGARAARSAPTAPIADSGASRTGGRGDGNRGELPPRPEVTRSTSSHSPRRSRQRCRASGLSPGGWTLLPASPPPLARPGRGGAGSVGRTSVGAPRGWASPPPPPPAHLGPAPTPSRVWCRRAGGKLQRTDEARRPSVRLLCFVNLFSNGERLRAVVRHRLGSSPLGEDVRPETRERVAPRTGPLRGSERGARRSVFEWRHIIS